MFLPSNVSTNKFATPNNTEGDASGLMIDVPLSSGTQFDWQKNFALVTSLMLCNRTNGNVGVSAKIVNGITAGFLINGINIPPNLSYDIISGNKITLKEGDKLYVWHNNSSANALDAVISFTLHRPLTTYDI